MSEEEIPSWDEVKEKMKDKPLEEQILIFCFTTDQVGNTIQIHHEFGELMGYSELEIETALEIIKENNWMDLGEDDA